MPLAAVLGRGQSAVPAVTRPAALLLLPGPLDGQPIGVDGRRGGRSCRGGSCRRSSRTAAAARCSSSRGRRRRRLAPLRSFLSHHAPGRLVGIERRRGRRVGDGGGPGMIATRSATTTTITGICRRHRRRRRRLGPVLLGRRRPPEVVLERAHAGGRGVVAAGGRRLPAAAAGARHDPDGASAVQSNPIQSRNCHPAATNCVFLGAFARSWVGTFRGSRRLLRWPKSVERCSQVKPARTNGGGRGATDQYDPCLGPPNPMDSIIRRARGGTVATLERY